MAAQSRKAQAAKAPAAPVQRAAVARRSAEIAVDPQVKVLREYAQSQALEDPFRTVYTAANSPYVLIEPPYNMASLVRLPDENAALRQCIAAMTTNVVGHGYRLEYIGKGKPDDADAVAEKEALEAMIDHPNADMNYAEFARRVWDDYETTGNGTIECGRDAKNRITMLHHVVAETMRLSQRDTEQTPVTVKLPRDGKLTDVTTKKRFRRFCQVVAQKRVYFKELGDPRSIDPETGEPKELSLVDAATEIAHLCNYNPRSPYGSPRWIGQLPSVLGSRQAELTNLDFFSENAVPAMALLVSGGIVSQATIDAMDENVNAARGRSSLNRILLIEVQGDPNNAAENGQIPAPKVEIKPLAGDRQNEGNFLEYLKACIDLIRSAFRLPPLFIGKSEEMTHATAKTAFEVAESQVFAPERERWDSFMNDVVLASWEPKFWRFKSQGPRLRSAEEVVTALTAFDQLGALTPNIAIGIANELLGLQIDEVDGEWGNWPFSIVLELAKKGELIGMEEITMDAATREKLRPTPEVLDPTTGEAVKPGANPAAAKAKAKPKDAAKKQETSRKTVDALLAIHAAITAKHEAETAEEPQHVHVEA